MSSNHYNHLSKINDPRFEGGEVLYCNGLGGLSKVEVVDPLLKAKLSTPSCTRGNNVLIQLREILKDYPDGPWYVDCINGIIYIHNSKFEDTSTDTYVFKAEPGEVLSVNISLQDKHEPKKGSKFNLLDNLDNGQKQLDVMLNNFYGDANQPTFWEQANSQVDWTDPDALAKVHSATNESIDNYLTQSYTANKAEVEVKNKTNEKVLEDLETLPGQSQYQEADLLRMMKNNPQMRSSFKDYVSTATSENYRVDTDGTRYLRVGNTPERIRRTSDITNGATMDQMVSGNTYNVPFANFKINQTKWDYKRMIEQNALKVYHGSGPKEESMGTQGMNWFTAMGTRADGYQSSYFWEMSAAGQVGDQGYIREDHAMKLLAAAGDPQAQQIVNLQNQVDNIKNYIKNMVKKAKEKELTCNMVVVGKPSLGCSRNMKVLNIGEHYSGVWYVKTVTHSLSSSGGYTTSLDMTFRKKLKSSKQ